MESGKPRFDITSNQCPWTIKAKDATNKTTITKVIFTKRLNVEKLPSLSSTDIIISCSSRTESKQINPHAKIFFFFFLSAARKNLLLSEALFTNQTLNSQYRGLIRILFEKYDSLIYIQLTACASKQENFVYKSNFTYRPSLETKTDSVFPSFLQIKRA